MRVYKECDRNVTMSNDYLLETSTFPRENTPHPLPNDLTYDNFEIIIDRLLDQIDVYDRLEANKQSNSSSSSSSTIVNDERDHSDDCAFSTDTATSDDGSYFNSNTVDVTATPVYRNTDTTFMEADRDDVVYEDLLCDETMSLISPIPEHQIKLSKSSTETTEITEKITARGSEKKQRVEEYNEDKSAETFINVSDYMIVNIDEMVNEINIPFERTEDIACQHFDKNLINISDVGSIEKQSKINVVGMSMLKDDNTHILYMKDDNGTADTSKKQILTAARTRPIDDNDIREIGSYKITSRIHSKYACNGYISIADAVCFLAITMDNISKYISIGGKEYMTVHSSGYPRTADKFIVKRKKRRYRVHYERVKCTVGRCLCPLKVSENYRRRFRDIYTKMPNTLKSIFFSTFVDKYRRLNKKRFDHDYYIGGNSERIPVCKHYFLKTLGVCKSTMERWLTMEKDYDLLRKLLNKYSVLA